tara:strand:+ start:29612 stop:30160 length:549 start_codon:yes stop_codon:yes gene_type:complete
MERKLNNKLQLWCKKFKDDVIGEIQKIYLNGQNDNDLSNEKNKQVLDLIQMIYDYENIKINTNDLQKRKRVKNVVPLYERCHALRANLEQCTRKKRKGECFCGTHMKGCPHGTIENSKEIDENEKIQVSIWAQDIKGIIYYIDENNNVYEPNDIMKAIDNPRRIAHWKLNDNGNYTIPEFNI